MFSVELSPNARYDVVDAFASEFRTIKQNPEVSRTQSESSLLVMIINLRQERRPFDVGYFIC